MFSPALSTLPLPPRLASHPQLHSSPLLAADVLLRPTPELSASLRLAERDVVCLQHAAANALAPAPKSVADEEHEEEEAEGEGGQALQTGDARLDKLLGGGVQRGVITELVGESSSGKTQLLLQLAAYSALGLSSPASSSSSSPPTPASSSSPRASSERWRAPIGVALLSTSGLASASSLVRRLVEISDHAVLSSLRSSSSSSSSEASTSSGKQQARPSVFEAEEVELARQRMLQNVHVACVGDGEALEHALLYTLPALIHRLSCDAAGTAAASSSATAGGGTGAAGVSSSQPQQQQQQQQLPAARSSSSSSQQQQQAASSASQQAELGLIIIDDLPALFHDETSGGTMSSLVARSRMLFELADRLKVLAHCGGQEEAATAPTTSEAGARRRREIAVVVVNHVSDVFERERALAISSARELLSLSSSPASLSSSSSLHTPTLADLPRSLRLARQAGLDAPLAFVQQSAPISGLFATNEALLSALRHDEDARAIEAASGRLKQAALGLPWVNGINTRLLLARSAAMRSSSGEEGSKSRQQQQQVGRATLLFSPFASAQTRPVRYVIGAQGITSLADEESDAR